MIRRAFTIVELLVVIAILAVLLAILSPVFARVKEAAYGAQSQSNLRNIYIGLEVYRAEQDVNLGFGDFTAMGLPPAFSSTLKKMLDAQPAPLSPHRHEPDEVLGRHYFCTWLGFYDWKGYSLTEQGNSVLLVDPFFNDERTSLVKPSRVTHKFLACRLNGSIKWKFGVGDWMDSPFWRQ